MTVLNHLLRNAVRQIVLYQVVKMAGKLYLHSKVRELRLTP